jgi:hypothetical protein
MAKVMALNHTTALTRSNLPDRIGTSPDAAAHDRRRDGKRIAPMATQTKLGRNDLCACGSGKKFKNCCEGKTASSGTSKVLIAVVAAAILGGIAAGVLTFRESASAGPAPGKVWSPEHGHFH